MLKSNELSLEIRINENTMAKELGANEDCRCVT